MPGLLALLPFLGGLAERECPAPTQPQSSEVEGHVGHREHQQQDHERTHARCYAALVETDDRRRSTVRARDRLYRLQRLEVLRIELDAGGREILLEVGR